MYERSGLDALHSGELALRGVQNLVCGATDLSHVTPDQLFFLLAIIIRELEEASAKLERA